MSEEPDSPKVESEKYVLRRRKFLRGLFEEKGRATQAEIEGWLGRQPERQSWSVKAIRGDVQFMQAYEDRPIFEARSEHGKFQWIDDSQKLGSTRDERRARNRAKKMKTAEIAIAVIMGLEEFTFVRPNFEDEEVGEKVTVSKLSSIMKQLEGYAVEKKLRNFWSTSHRSMFIDAGTTMEVFATEYLQHVKVPLRGHKIRNSGADRPEIFDYVSKIEAITNDREIFYRLGQQTVHTRTIVVGGRQQFRSSAISGMMAQKFLEVNEITAGAALLGCGGVCLSASEDDGMPEDSYIVAENEHVAAIKLAFRDRAAIKIVLADSTKFGFSNGTTDTKVCAISPSTVDMVITDSAEADVRARFRDLNVPLIVYQD